ncbi:MAG TPA: hypothetical protein VFQ91_01040 [Bryobacteraceae bacterium]|nr:hypothetical protein [Bryobacteraceae bacterium]
MKSLCIRALPELTNRDAAKLRSKDGPSWLRLTRKRTVTAV